jgi:hypothetical protein
LRWFGYALMTTARSSIRNDVESSIVTTYSMLPYSSAFFVMYRRSPNSFRIAQTSDLGVDPWSVTNESRSQCQLFGCISR